MYIADRSEQLLLVLVMMRSAHATAIAVQSNC
jgi:hypothetical protein